jgi:CheY-like chemotaxis protein
VVDDYHDGAAAISMFLSPSGYDTRYFLSVTDVALAVAGSIPEIVLLDINMPGMDGFAVARQDWRTQDIAILAFTALDEPVFRKGGIAAGFDACCQKGRAPDSLHVPLSSAACAYAGATSTLSE